MFSDRQGMIFNHQAIRLAIFERAVDVPQARGRVAPVHGPVVLTVVCVFINHWGALYIYKHLYAPRKREPYGALGGLSFR